MNYEERVKLVRDLLKSYYLNLCEITDIEHIIVKHIDGHKWLINEEIPFIISYKDAVHSWEVNVYLPVMTIINNCALDKIFNMDKMALFLRIQDHVFYMSKTGKELNYPYDAINSYVKANVASKFKRFLYYMRIVF